MSSSFPSLAIVVFQNGTSTFTVSEFDGVVTICLEPANNILGREISIDYFIISDTGIDTVANRLSLCASCNIAIMCMFLAGLDPAYQLLFLCLLGCFYHLLYMWVVWCS